VTAMFPFSVMILGLVAPARTITLSRSGAHRYPLFTAAVTAAVHVPDWYWQTAAARFAACN